MWFEFVVDLGRSLGLFGWDRLTQIEGTKSCDDLFCALVACSDL